MRMGLNVIPHSVYEANGVHRHVGDNPSGRTLRSPYWDPFSTFKKAIKAFFSMSLR